VHCLSGNPEPYCVCPRPEAATQAHERTPRWIRPKKPPTRPRALGPGFQHQTPREPPLTEDLHAAARFNPHNPASPCGLVHRAVSSLSRRSAPPSPRLPRAAKLMRPLTITTPPTFFSSLILLLFPAFAVVSDRGFPLPSCNHEYGGGGMNPQTSGNFFFGSPPSPLVPKWPFHRKFFRLNSGGSENHSYPSGRQDGGSPSEDSDLVAGEAH
jgi:hypothetical protein